MTNENEGSDELILLRKKADAYWLLQKIVHISYKSGHWKRGVIKSINSDFFVLEERLEGEQEVFFLEIKDIRAYTPPLKEEKA